jgi:hypothetical protein
MPRSSHPPRFDHSKYTWRRVQIMMLLVMQFSPPARHFIPFGPDILSTPFSNILSLCSSHNVSFTTIQNHRQNHGVVYSNFYVFPQQTRSQKVLDWMVTSITRIQSPLNFFRIRFWFVTVVPVYLNFDPFSNDMFAILCYNFDLHSDDFHFQLSV